MPTKFSTSDYRVVFWLLSTITFLSLNFSIAVGQTYTSVKSGFWNDPSVWSPSPSSGHPSATDQTITISNSHVITIPDGLTITVDELVINGTIQLSTLGKLIIANGSGLDLQCSGILKVAGTLEFTDKVTHSGLTVSNTQFLSGSRYRHLYSDTEGVLPLANWDSSSTLEVSGFTIFNNATAIGNWSQHFGHIEWNCALQSSTVAMNGLLQFTNGNFTIKSTGAGILEFAKNQAATISIGGDLSIGGNSKIHFSSAPLSGSSQESVVYSIGGNFNYTSTDSSGSVTNEMKQTTFTIGHNFYMNAPGGKLILSKKVSNIQTNDGTTFNIYGNFELVSGQIYTKDVSGKLGYFNFVGDSVTHTFLNTGIISGAINYAVKKTNTLQILGESAVTGGTASTFTLGELTGGSTLIVESTDAAGAIQLGNTNGNIRVGNGSQRIYNPNSKIIYQGKSIQYIGNGQPGTTNAGTTSTSLQTIINNDNGVMTNSTTTTTVTIAGELNIERGNVTITNNSLTVNGNINLTGGNIFIDASNATVSAKTLTAKAVINLSGGQINLISGNANGDNAILAINGDIMGTKYFTFSGANCRVSIGGTAPLIFSRDFPIAGPTMLEQLTINRDGVTLIIPFDMTVGNATNTTSGLTLTKGNLKMNGNLTVDVNLKLTSGTLFFENQTLELKRMITCTEQPLPTASGYLSANENSTLKITGTYSNTANENTLLFSPTGSTLGTFIINRTSLPVLPHVTLNNSLTIKNNLYLTNGKFFIPKGLALSGNATLTRSANSTFYQGSNDPSGGPYNVIYTDGLSPVLSDLKTGIELNGLLNDVTSNCSDSVVLSNNLIARGTLRIHSGSWISQDKTISIHNLINESSFTASDTTIINETLTNNGNFNHANGLIIFNGLSSISGTKKPIFHSLHILNSLTNSSSFELELQGDFVNDSIFNPANGTIVFSGSGLQKIKGNAPSHFNNIKVTNATTNPSLSIESESDMKGILTLSANTIVDVDGPSDKLVFTILSSSDSPSNDGAIAALPQGASVIGKLSVQRYVSGEGRIYRYLSSPVANAKIADWMDDFPITGKFKDPSTTAQWPTQALCGYPLNSASSSLYFYDESKNNYIAYPQPGKLSTESTIEVGRGYTAFIRQCNKPVIIDASGEINQGTISIPVTYTVDTSDYIGWNLVGNPYPSAIDWNVTGVSGWTKNKIASTLSIRDNGTGAFKYWDGTGIPNDIPGGVIASGQAFWVRATGDNPQLIAREGIKSNKKTAFFRIAQPPTITIELTDNITVDKAYIKLRPEANEGLDNFDAVKLDNTLFDISSLSADSISMAINASPTLWCEKGMQLKLSDMEKGVYTLILSYTEESEKTKIKLLDQFTKTTYSLDWNEPYSFAINENPESKNAYRFVLFLTTEELVPPTPILTSPVCSTSALLSLRNTEQNILYSIWLMDGEKISDDLQGADSILLAPLNPSQLQVGSNQVFIKYMNTCTVANTLPFGFEFENPTADSVSGGRSCLAGSVTLYAHPRSLADKTKWYSSIDSDTPIALGTTFKTPQLDSTATYFATIETSSGCEGEKIAVLAEIVQFKNPTIQLEENKLVTNFSAGVSWYVDNVLIPNADSSYIIPFKSGLYSVKIIVKGCEAEAQLPFIISSTEPDKPSLIYNPNPFSDYITLNLPERNESIKTLNLISSNGQRNIIQYQNDNGEITLCTSSLSTGLYLLEIQTERNKYFIKVIKK